jgi:Zn-dependent membrane protease YugP
VLDQGKELQRLDAQLAEEAHQNSGIAGVLVVQDAKYVETDHCSPKPIQRLDDQALGRQTVRVTAVRIVVLGGAVQTKSDGESFPR